MKIELIKECMRWTEEGRRKMRIEYGHNASSIWLYDFQVQSGRHVKNQHDIPKEGELKKEKLEELKREMAAL